MLRRPRLSINRMSVSVNHAFVLASGWARADVLLHAETASSLFLVFSVVTRVCKNNPVEGMVYQEKGRHVSRALVHRYNVCRMP